MPDPAITSNEIILIETSVFLPETFIVTWELDIFLDYSFSSKVKSTFKPSSHRVFIRRVFNPTKYTIRPLNLSSPVRGELEVGEYTRQYLIDTFDKSAAVISVPLLTFIDGFGLFRNMYRTLMGVYMIIAAFTFRERARRSNVLPLTLGPHGSNFSDVINALQALYHLDAGQNLNINGQDVFVCVYTMAYIGNMPQQQENAGFLSVKANLSCRYCFAGGDERADTEIDIVTHGRYHHETLRMRDHMKTLTKTAQLKYSTQNGIGLSPPPLLTISPALDIIHSRPSNPAHSEYGGITKQLHELLMNEILTTKSQQEYANRLRNFCYPSNWGRLQSPMHHLGSYSLQEHTRWSVISPVLLRVWLRAHHVRPLFLRGIEKAWKGHIPGGQSPINFIVALFAAVGRSNAILMSDSISNADQTQIATRIQLARHYYQQLLEAASLAVADNPRRSRSVTPQSQTGTQEAQRPNEVKTAKKY